jgi:hypothetical protein
MRKLILVFTISVAACGGGVPEDDPEIAVAGKADESAIW